jgi:hypothetical protein
MTGNRPAAPSDTPRARAASSGRPLAAIVLPCAIAAIALGACGGASAPPPVASVQGTPITREALAHWTAVKRAELQASPGAPSPSEGELKLKALAFLITSAWLEKEAAAQGVSVPASQTRASYEQLLHGPTGQNFANSLRLRHMSMADELMVLRLGALAQRLSTRVTGGSPGSSAQARRQISSFLGAYRQRWKQRTACSAGYVIAECANGPALPAQGL